MNFSKFSSEVTHSLGSTKAFLIAIGTVLVWAMTGPLFHFSEIWQLVINTGTTIITFLMVFIIQHTQNKDNLALHAKLDELIKANQDASNHFRGIEKLTEDEILKVEKEEEEMDQKIEEDMGKKL